MLRTLTPDQVRALKLAGPDTTAAVFKLGRSRLYKIARVLGLYPPPQTGNSCPSTVNDEQLVGLDEREEQNLSGAINEGDCGLFDKRRRQMPPVSFAVGKRGIWPFSLKSPA